MKNLIFVALSIMLVTACNQEKRYTQQSTEIESYKEVIENYIAQDWKSFATHYADTTMIFNNATKDKGQTLTELIASYKAGAELFNS
jgi:outer membrane protein assembly factor BamD (BamD/ComL family)